jgi:hypothetical protein
MRGDEARCGALGGGRSIKIHSTNLCQFFYVITGAPVIIRTETPQQKLSASTTSGSRPKNILLCGSKRGGGRGPRGVSQPSIVLDIAEIRFKPQPQLPTAACVAVPPPPPAPRHVSITPAAPTPSHGDQKRSLSHPHLHVAARILSLTSVANRTA